MLSFPEAGRLRSQSSRLIPMLVRGIAARSRFDRRRKRRLQSVTVVRFEDRTLLSASVTGSIVESVSLTFNVVNTTDDTYEIYQRLRPWVESDVTYNRAADGVDWEVAGALGTGDRDPTAFFDDLDSALDSL